MKTLLMAAAIVALSAPVALAQNAPKRPAADASQAQSDVPDAVKTYVKNNAGDPFPYAGQIKLGDPVLDAGDTWLSIPDYPQYLWKNLGGELVVIDKQSRKVVWLY